MKKKENKTKELYQKVVDGIENIISSGEYKKFLKFSSSFYHYSFNNWILIFSQMKNASRVAGFKAWEKMGRKIKKGSKGIMIMYPMKQTYTKKIKGQESLIDKNNDKSNTEEKIEFLTYRATYVYDISQTTGKPLPLENKYLNSSSKEELYEFLKSYSKYPILEQNISNGAQGYWDTINKEIVLEKKLSIDDRVSVLLHEMTHSLYDDFDYKEHRDLSEIFVESVAFIVADYFGLDTSMCSFNYITKWSKGDIKPILELGSKIQKTSKDFIEKLEKELNEDNLKIAS